MWKSCHHELVITSLFLKIVVETVAMKSTTCFETCGQVKYGIRFDVKKGHAIGVKLGMQFGVKKGMQFGVEKVYVVGGIEGPCGRG